MLQDKEDLTDLYDTACGHSKSMGAAVKHLIRFGVIGFDTSDKAPIGETFYSVEKFLTGHGIKIKVSLKKKLIWTSYCGSSSLIFKQDVSKVYTFQKF